MKLARAAHLISVRALVIVIAAVAGIAGLLITAGPGALAFGSVVVLTMVASMQFDPRLIWDYVAEGKTEKPQESKHD